MENYECPERKVTVDRKGKLRLLLTVRGSVLKGNDRFRHRGFVYSRFSAFRGICIVPFVRQGFSFSYNHNLIEDYPEFAS
jgi:hypothetical protein